MKGNLLFEKIISLENLYRAAQKSRRRKRNIPEVAAFHVNIENELPALRRELASGSYRPGGYRQFQVREKKTRLISAAPYRDRVVHHAVMNVVEPILNRSFVFDSYANRVGKGSHKAVDRFQKHLKTHRYVLKCDIRKYFHSIDHAHLKRLIEEKIQDFRAMELVRLIIDTSPPQEPVYDYFPGDGLFEPFQRRRGLPIGNLTSQFFANFYLDGADHFVKEELKAGAYVRYVDDFAAFGNDKEKLRNIRFELDDYLCRLRLKLHESKTRIFKSDEGVTFLGYRVFPDGRRIERQNAVNFRRRLARSEREFEEGKIGLKTVKMRISGWLGHARHADTAGLRENIFSNVVFARGRARNAQRSSRRVVEQQQRQPPRVEPQQQQPVEQEQQQRVPLCPQSL